MARKITMTGQFRKSVAEVFEDFVLSQMAQGLSDITIATYRHHIHSISNHLDIQKPMEALTRKDLEAMIVSMRASGLAHNSISSYCRVFRTFSNWCRRAGLNIPELPNIKDKETVKEAYTDAELLALLKRPNKNGKIQTVPLCSQMVSILREYMPIRGGKPEDYLFCDQYGGMLSMNGLRLAIARHNQSRGVEKTSAHLYRHTFARKYLVDCGGDAFMLQRLLGHSTLKMTKHYCAIYDADIAKDYDRFSPLAQLNQPKEKIHRR